jgi:hypothetical protein
MAISSIPRLQGGDSLGCCVIGQGSACGMAGYIRGRKSRAGGGMEGVCGVEDGSGDGEGGYGGIAR